MSRALFLTSAGFRKNNQTEFRHKLVNSFKGLVGRDLQDLKCAYIPTAADLEEDKSFMEDTRQEILDLGMDVLDVDLKEDKNTVRKKLESSDVIYINGGNTFYLLDWVRKSGLDKYLGKLLDEGKIYVGVSAGSVIVGPNIAVAGWGPYGDINGVNLKDLSGLGLVPFAVSPHFTEVDKEILEKNLQNINYEVIPLTDEQALLVKDRDWQLVGNRD